MSDFECGHGLFCDQDYCPYCRIEELEAEIKRLRDALEHMRGSVCDTSLYRFAKAALAEKVDV